MKRLLSVTCLIVFLLSMFIIPQASAASSAETFAQTAVNEIGRNGRYYGYTDNWCARFVIDCAKKANISSSIPNQPNAPLMASWFNNNGRFALTRRNSSGVIECWSRGTWISNLPEANYNFTPEKGDIAFIETNNIPADGIDHVGIVVAVAGNSVTVVEGNTGGNGVADSKVSQYTRDWRTNNSKIWGFARPAACGNMTTQITTGPTLTVSTNSSNSSALITWAKVPGADFYEIELYDDVGWDKVQHGIYHGYVQKIYNITGTSYTFSGLDKGKNYHVQVAACNNSGQWKFGPAVGFIISSGTTSGITITSLISTKTCRGYLTVSSNQQAYTDSALSSFDGSYIYPTDYCRLVRASGNTLLVEYPTSNGATKQRWIAANMFFCNFNYSVWSKTATKNITVTSRPGTGVTVGTVYNGDLVYVLGTSGSYYQVLYPAGDIWKFGYVLSGNL